MKIEKRNADGLTEKEFLAQYNPGDYKRPSVTVDMMVLRMKKDLSCMQILLIKRKNHPDIGCWALPGGFIEINESAYQAACRELEEETGLTGVYLEQLYTMSQPDRDPRMRVIDISYIALLPHDYSVQEQAGDDAEDATWFDITFKKDKILFDNADKNVRIDYKLIPQSFKNGVITIDNFIPVQNKEEKLAFDHAQIILEGLMRLQSKVMYSDIAFNLVPLEFTLPDLQKVYEIICEKDLYKANFREHIKNKIIPTGKQIKPISSIRSSAGYKYRKQS